MRASASVDKDEIARFSSHAEDWWNPEGALRPLHKLNPPRLRYIRDTVTQHFKRHRENDSLKGLSILDIGCGGGLLTEPMSRMGANVTGLDASFQAIKVAKAHALQEPLKITYHHSSAEEFVDSRQKFDVITALEILEHVSDINSLLKCVEKLLKPKGIVILSTLNRTPKSFLLGIVAAEYILRWVPKGTHDWRKFIRPSELDAYLKNAGMRTVDLTGMIYEPFNDSFNLKPGVVGVNYLLAAVKSN